MLSGRGYCTQPSCFPVLGAPLIPVFLCQTHCGHMLCYRHWLSHQTNETILTNPPIIAHPISSMWSTQWLRERR